ncbi:MAG: lipid-A-disaccharide synthase N-terminal domain-containing protein [bacterium]
MIENIITLLNPWVVFGFMAQFVFFLRFAVQWWVSEKKKQSVIPVSFWYLSLVGTFMILIYSIQRKDIVFITASCLNSLIYIRNLILIRNTKNKTQQNV